MIKSVIKATDILNIVSKSYDKPLPLSFIAKKLDINISTCAHIVKTLVNEGYLKKGEKGGYMLGINALGLSKNFGYICYLREIIQPELNSFVIRHGEEILSAVLINGKRHVFCKAAISDGGIDTKVVSDAYGIHLPTGRVLLAHETNDERYKIINENGGLIKYSKLKPCSNMFELNVALDKIRDEELYIPDDNQKMYHAAVPVIAYDRLICALGSSIPKSRCNYWEAYEIFSDLLSVAQRISLIL